MPPPRGSGHNNNNNNKHKPAFDLAAARNSSASGGGGAQTSALTPSALQKQQQKEQEQQQQQHHQRPESMTPVCLGSAVAAASGTVPEGLRSPISNTSFAGPSAVDSELLAESTTEQSLLFSDAWRFVGPLPHFQIAPPATHTWPAVASVNALAAAWQRVPVDKLRDNAAIALIRQRPFGKSTLVPQERMQLGYVQVLFSSDAAPADKALTRQQLWTDLVLAVLGNCEFHPFSSDIFGIRLSVLPFNAVFPNSGGNNSNSGGPSLSSSAAAAPSSPSSASASASSSSTLSRVELFVRFSSAPASPLQSCCDALGDQLWQFLGDYGASYCRRHGTPQGGPFSVPDFGALEQSPLPQLPLPRPIVIQRGGRGNNNNNKDGASTGSANGGAGAPSSLDSSSMLLDRKNSLPPIAPSPTNSATSPNATSSGFPPPQQQHQHNVHHQHHYQQQQQQQRQSPLAAALTGGGGSVSNPPASVAPPAYAAHAASNHDNNNDSSCEYAEDTESSKSAGRKSGNGRKETSPTPSKGSKTAGTASLGGESSVLNSTGSPPDDPNEVLRVQSEAIANGIALDRAIAALLPVKRSFEKHVTRLLTEGTGHKHKVKTMVRAIDEKRLDVEKAVTESMTRGSSSAADGSTNTENGSKTAETKSKKSSASVVAAASASNSSSNSNGFANLSLSRSACPCRVHCGSADDLPARVRAQSVATVEGVPPQRVAALTSLLLHQSKHLAEYLALEREKQVALLMSAAHALPSFSDLNGKKKEEARRKAATELVDSYFSNMDATSFGTLFLLVGDILRFASYAVFGNSSGVSKGSAAAAHQQGKETASGDSHNNNNNNNNNNSSDEGADEDDEDHFTKYADDARSITSQKCRTFVAFSRNAVETREALQRAEAVAKQLLNELQQLEGKGMEQNFSKWQQEQQQQSLAEVIGDDEDQERSVDAAAAAAESAEQQQRQQEDAVSAQEPTPVSPPTKTKGKQQQQQQQPQPQKPAAGKNNKKQQQRKGVSPESVVSESSTTAGAASSPATAAASPVPQQQQPQQRSGGNTSKSSNASASAGPATPATASAKGTSGKAGVANSAPTSVKLTAPLKDSPQSKKQQQGKGGGGANASSSSVDKAAALIAESPKEGDVRRFNWLILALAVVLIIALAGFIWLLADESNPEHSELELD